MDSDSQQVSYFNEIAIEYDSLQPVFVLEYETMLNLITDLIVYLSINKTDCTILDLGCGTGNLLQKIRSKLPNSSLVGIDKSPQMIELARQKTQFGEKTNYYVMDLKDFRMGEEFDFVLSTFSVHHLKNEEKKKLFVQIFDVLKSGGWSWVADNVQFESSSLVKWIQTTYNRQIDELIKGGVIEKKDLDRKKMLKKLAEQTKTEIDYRTTLDNYFSFMHEAGFSLIDSIYRLGGRVIFGGYKS